MYMLKVRDTFPMDSNPKLVGGAYLWTLSIPRWPPIHMCLVANLTFIYLAVFVKCTQSSMYILVLS